MADDDLAALNVLDNAARKIGRAIFRFRHLSTGRKAVVVVVLFAAVVVLVRGCNALTSSTDPASFNAGRIAGYLEVLVQHSGGGPPTLADIRDACTREASILAANGYSWVEGGVHYDIKAADVDEASVIAGCVEGVKSALRGAPAP